MHINQCIKKLLLKHYTPLGMKKYFFMKNLWFLYSVIDTLNIHCQTLIDALMYKVIASEVFSSDVKKDKSCENGSHFIKKTSHLEEIAKLYSKNGHIDSYHMQTDVKKKKKC